MTNRWILKSGALVAISGIPWPLLSTTGAAPLFCFLPTSLSISPNRPCTCAPSFSMISGGPGPSILCASPFTMNVVANQPFYLPGQNADLTVSANYMFGKPVLRGHVRMVREARREWNYREQKWETEQGESQEGELDAKNEFRATLCRLP